MAAAAFAVGAVDAAAPDDTTVAAAFLGGANEDDSPPALSSDSLAVDAGTHLSQHMRWYRHSSSYQASAKYIVKAGCMRIRVLLSPLSAFESVERDGIIIFFTLDSHFLGPHPTLLLTDRGALDRRFRKYPRGLTSDIRVFLNRGSIAMDATFTSQAIKKSV